MCFFKKKKSVWDLKEVERNLLSLGYKESDNYGETFEKVVSDKSLLSIVLDEQQIICVWEIDQEKYILPREVHNEAGDECEEIATKYTSKFEVKFVSFECIEFAITDKTQVLNYEFLGMIDKILVEAAQKMEQRIIEVKKGE